MSIAASLDRRFAVSARGSTLSREAIGGATTFLAAAYLVAVIPSLLASGGLDRGAATTATILLIAAGSIAMGLYANLPFLVGPGIGGSALLGVTLAQAPGIGWHTGLGIALISGLAFLVLTLSGARAIVVRLVPLPIKLGLGASIGLFIAMLGLRDAGMVAVNMKTHALMLGNFRQPGVVAALVGLAVALAMDVRRWPGAVLAGIVVAALVGVPLGVTRLPATPLSLPDALTLWQASPGAALTLLALPYMFAFFAAEFFSTLGTTLAIGGKAGLTDAAGNLPGIERPFLVDAIAATIGPLIGIPAATALIESAAGVEAGARTGLAPIVAAGLFLLLLLLLPLAMAIPREATAPALILIGVAMIASLRALPASAPGEGVAAVFPPVAMMLVTLIANSFGTGIAAGILLYVIVELLAGRWRRLPPGLVVLALPLGYFLVVAATATH